MATTSIKDGTGASSCGQPPSDLEQSRFIFHLHPENGSAMEDWLVKTRDVVAKEYGMDDSYLYPPHVSMSGWVETSHKKMEAVVSRLKEMIQERLTKLLDETKKVGTMSTVATQDTMCHSAASPTSEVADASSKETSGSGERATDASASSSKPSDAIERSKPSVGSRAMSPERGYRSGYVSSEKTTCTALPRGPGHVAFVGRILTTETGYVLNDLSSAFLHQLMLDIDFETANDVVIKGKPINHITLANCRPVHKDAADRDAIMEVYTREFCRYIKPEDAPTRWQIVVYEMKKRTPKGKVAELGPHVLHAFATIPVWLQNAAAAKEQ